MNEPTANHFSALGIEARSTKPRNVGLTIAVEFGAPLEYQRSLLELAGDTIDYAKIAVGIAGLMPQDQLRQKIDLYREHDILAFPGGMFLEYAFAKDQVELYLDSVCAAGFEVVEVSDNAVDIGLHKVGLVELALARDLVVLGEVGSKSHSSLADDLVSDAQRLLDAGCLKVLIEAAEFFEGAELRLDLVEAIETRLPLADIVFELPGPWLSGVHTHDVISFEAWLVSRFGPDVNIANDPLGNSLFLESYRRGVGPNLLERL